MSAQEFISYALGGLFHYAFTFHLNNHSTFFFPHSLLPTLPPPPWTLTPLRTRPLPPPHLSTLPSTTSHTAKVLKITPANAPLQTPPLAHTWYSTHTFTWSPSSTTPLHTHLHTPAPSTTHLSAPSTTHLSHLPHPFRHTCINNVTGVHLVEQGSNQGQ